MRGPDRRLLAFGAVGGVEAEGWVRGMCGQAIAGGRGGLGGLKVSTQGEHEEARRPVTDVRRAGARWRPKQRGRPNARR